MALAKPEERRSVLIERTVEKLDLTPTGILRDLGQDPSDVCVASWWQAARTR
jgi:hypothetical protein